jgi:hypothetical protein
MILIFEMAGAFDQVSFKGLPPFSFSYAAHKNEKVPTTRDPGRLPETTTPDAMGLMSALEEDTRVHSEPFDTPPESGGVRMWW